MLIIIHKHFILLSQYIASRLLTDPSVELQLALRQLLFRDGKPRWERLEELLQQASSTNDYDFSLALDQGLTFLISDQGASLRENLSEGTVNFIDEVIFGTIDYGGVALRDSITTLLKTTDGSSGSTGSTVGSGGSLIPGLDRINAILQVITDRGFTSVLQTVLLNVSDSMAKYSINSADTEEAAALDSAARLIKIFLKSASNSSVSGDSERYTRVLRRALREPVSQTLIADMLSELSERVTAKSIKRIFSPRQIALK